MCDDGRIEEKLASVGKCSDECHRALYGHNGETGLISEVRSVAKDVTKIMTNDLPHLEADMLKVITLLEEKSVTWPGLAKGLVTPIVIAVITSVIVTVLHGLLF